MAGKFTQSLKDAILETAEQARVMTKESLNALPEYYMVVKVAEKLNDAMTTFGVRFEVPMEMLLAEMGLQKEEVQLSRQSGKADLVLSSQKNRYVVEFKRSINSKSLRQDTIRLAQLCLLSGQQGWNSKNYLVAITARDVETVNKREEDMADWLKQENKQLAKVKVKAVPIEGLEKYTNTRPSGNKLTKAPLTGCIWELSYQA